jgi:hypothetical protein
MKFLYRKYPAKKKEIIEVRTDQPAMVKFMTAAEFKKYAGGRTHSYFKGQETDGAICFTLPYDGVWHAVVEKGTDPAMEELSATSILRMPDPEPEQLPQSFEDEGDAVPENDIGEQAVDMEESPEE